MKLYADDLKDFDENLKQLLEGKTCYGYLTSVELLTQGPDANLAQLMMFLYNRDKKQDFEVNLECLKKENTDLNILRPMLAQAYETKAMKIMREHADQLADQMQKARIQAPMFSPSIPEKKSPELKVQEPVQRVEPTKPVEQFNVNWGSLDNPKVPDLAQSMPPAQVAQSQQKPQLGWDNINLDHINANVPPN